MEQQDVNSSTDFDAEEILSILEKNEKPSLKSILTLCELIMDQLSNTDCLVHVNSPVTVVGNIAGQFPDLQQIFQIGGRVPDTNYLFLGGYVNRGKYSVECFTYLMALKLKFPNRITLLRGVSETEHNTRMYGLYDQCIKQYNSSQLWETLNSVFSFLPFTAVIENEIFCVSGGISPNFLNIEDIQSIKVRDVNLFEDKFQQLLLNDPEDNMEQDWGFNGRGPSEVFSKNVTKQFLHNNNLKSVMRANQLQMNGYTYFHDEKLCSIFSAPNYCNRVENMAAFIEIDEAMNYNIQKFSEIKTHQNKFKADLLVLSSHQKEIPPFLGFWANYAN